MLCVRPMSVASSIDPGAEDSGGRPVPRLRRLRGALNQFGPRRTPVAARCPDGDGGASAGDASPPRPPLAFHPAHPLVGSVGVDCGAPGLQTSR